MAMKMALIEHLNAQGLECEDYGSDDPVYANTAIRVAEAVAGGKHERGILICGTGIGVSISANKVPGAYAALVADPYDMGVQAGEIVNRLSAGRSDAPRAYARASRLTINTKVAAKMGLKIRDEILRRANTIE